METLLKRHLLCAWRSCSPFSLSLSVCLYVCIDVIPPNDNPWRKMRLLFVSLSVLCACVCGACCCYVVYVRVRVYVFVSRVCVCVILSVLRVPANLERGDSQTHRLWPPE